jgi:hypothetical protein
MQTNSLEKRHPHALGLDLCNIGCHTGTSVSKHLINSSFEKSVTITFEHMIAETSSDFGSSPQRLGHGAARVSFESGSKRPFLLVMCPRGNHNNSD